MSATTTTKIVPTFTVEIPQDVRAPIIFSSPHSGRHYHQEFIDASRLKLRKLRSLEDCYVDELFDHVVQQGAPFIKANFPRAFLDLNREPFELDAKLISPTLPTYANSSSLRVKAGLGTIPRIVADGSAIYRAPIQLPDALRRVDEYHTPYHNKLAELTTQARHKFGMALLLDCHSMPSNTNIYDNNITTDIVIGNRYNASCHPIYVDIATELFKSLGLSVKLNVPYAGGYITEHHGKPQNNIHALQIELNRGLYLDQITLKKSNKYEHLKEKLTQFTDQLMNQLSERHKTPLAAE